MRRTTVCLTSAALALALLAPQRASAEVTVHLKGVHLCCDKCVKGVADAAKKVQGVTVSCDKEAKTVTVTAPDVATAQKGVSAIGRGGYYGVSDNPEVKIRQRRRAPKGKVQSLKIDRLHNCCSKCAKALIAAVQSVPGVTGNTIEEKKGDFTVTGDFDAGALIQALNKAGFQPKFGGGKGKGKGKKKAR